MWFLLKKVYESVLLNIFLMQLARHTRPDEGHFKAWPTTVVLPGAVTTDSK